MLKVEIEKIKTYIRENDIKNKDKIRRLINKYVQSVKLKNDILECINKKDDINQCLNDTGNLSEFEIEKFKTDITKKDIKKKKEFDHI